MTEKLAYSVPQAAAAIGISRSKTWDLIRSGRLSSLKVDGRRLVPRWALEELLQDPSSHPAVGTTSRTDQLERAE